MLRPDGETVRGPSLGDIERGVMLLAGVEERAPRPPSISGVCGADLCTNSLGSTDSCRIF